MVRSKHFQRLGCQTSLPARGDPLSQAVQDNGLERCDNHDADVQLNLDDPSNEYQHSDSGTEITLTSSYAPATHVLVLREAAFALKETVQNVQASSERAVGQHPVCQFPSPAMAARRTGSLRRNVVDDSLPVDDIIANGRFLAEASHSAVADAYDDVVEKLGKERSARMRAVCADGDLPSEHSFELECSRSRDGQFLLSDAYLDVAHSATDGLAAPSGSGDLHSSKRGNRFPPKKRKPPRDTARACTNGFLLQKQPSGETQKRQPDCLQDTEILLKGQSDASARRRFTPSFVVGMRSYLSRMRASFGAKFLAMIFLSGGLSKGIGEAMVTFAAQYLYTDSPPSGFGLTAARVAAVNSLVHIPWVIKSLYGIVSDTTPLCGLHRTPYVVIGGVVGACAFAFLVGMPTHMPMLACTMLALVQFSFALPDVMVDAVLAEKTRSHPHHATDLQVLTMGSFGVCSIVGSMLKGQIFAIAGARSIFAIGLVTSLVVLPPAVSGWLGEARASAPERRCALADVLSPSHPGSGVFKLALVLSALALALAVTSVELEATPWVPPLLSLPVSALVCLACWRYERRVSADLAKASMYAFLQNAMQPSLVVMYKWYKATEENCNPLIPIPGVHPLPCFSPQFVGALDVVARGTFLIALGVYNRYLSSWRYRSIFATTQLALVVVNLLDLIWVTRLNLSIGIPDTAFALGAEILQPLVDRFSLIPLFVLVARLCPVEAQGTAFALNMGLLHLGSNIGSYVGMGILSLLGGVEPPAFENIGVLVTIRSLTRALPLLLIPFLLPSGSPMEDATQMAASSSVLQLKEAISQLGVWI